MAERTAHLVDHVLPDVPIRQWVLTFPHTLRYQMAWDHALCRAVVGALLRAVTGALRRRARIVGVADGRSGAVAVIQRFGGAVNLNVHVHALVLDGVYARDTSGALHLHPAAPLTSLDVDEVLATVEAYIRRVLVRRRRADGESGDVGDGWQEEAPLLAGLAAASVQGRVTVGAARRVRTTAAGADLGDDACHARHDAFDLHARLQVPAGQRDRLERVCRYLLRPPLATERMALTETGQVRLQLRHPWTDGTTHVEFEPVAFLERLAVLVPRPRVNLIVYYGVLAPRAAWRPEMVPGSERGEAGHESAGEPYAKATQRGTPRGYRWAELLRRTSGRM